MIMNMISKSIATMKNLFTRLMLVAVAAMGFVACQEGYEDVTITPEAKEIVMTFIAEAPDTRTSVDIVGDVAKYSWSEDDKVGFYYVATDVDYKKKGNSNKAVIADDGTATFTASFTPNDEASSYNIGAFYPGNSWMSHATENPFNNVKVKISNEQILTDGSFDPAADLMMSKPFMGVELNADAVKTLEFTRIAAIGKMNLKLTDMDEGEVIESVKFTFAEGIHFNGPVVLDLENSTYELGTTDTCNYVNLTGSLAANADRTAIFFTCFPGEYSGAYTIEVETDKATYSKTGELTKALTFTAGDVLNFNATVGDRAEVEEPGELTTYNLLTDIAELNAGDKIIIAAADSDFALSTTQNNNNRGQAAITKSGNTVSFNNDVQILTVEPGTTAGTFAFNTGSGYLYAASSSNNYLRTETTLSDNSSWKIEISGGPDYSASIIAQGANTRNWLRYNDASSMFSCYSSGQADVAIYYLDGEEPDYLTVSPKVIEFESIGGNKTFTVDTNIDDTVQIEHGSKFQISDPVDGVYTVTATENTTTEVIEDIITIKVGTLEDTISVSQKAATVSVEDEVVDVLNRALTGVTGTSYTEWSGKTVTSAAVYAGQSAGGNESIQLRSSNSNSGIVTTKSGGKAKKISVTWNSNTSSGRTLNIYGKNTAYSAATDLYNTSNQGTLLGTIVYGTSTELVIEGDYEYIGLRSNSGAMYLTEIQITWSASDDDTGGETGGDNTGGDNTGDVGDVNTTTIVKSKGLQASTTASYMDDVISYVNSAENNYSDPIRIYKNNVFTISAAEGHYITEVVFETPSSDYATALLNGTFAVDGGASVNVSNDGLIVTFKITGNSSQLKITASSAQFRASSISVTYTN